MKSQILSAFEKVTSNLDILENLFGLLDIGDQLRLANVSQQLQFVYANFISPDIDFKKVKIKKYSDTVHLNTDNSCKHYDLTHEEYEFFLNIFGNQVESLNESHGNALSISPQFKNLTRLKYNYLLITKQQIQLLAETCPQLEDLCINGCCNKKRELIRLIVDIEVSSLVAMSKLKSFSLKTGLNYKIKYGFAEEFTRKKRWPLNSSSRIESFNIYMPTLASKFLGLFAHLHSLTITVFHAVSNDEIIAVGNVCHELRKLAFNLTSFERIESFSHLKNLSDLSFCQCEGLTYENLKDILTRTQLVTFTSIGTKYEGLFHYYFLTPTMKSVYIDAIKPFDFKTEMEFYKERKSEGPSGS